MLPAVSKPKLLVSMVRKLYRDLLFHSLVPSVLLNDRMRTALLRRLGVDIDPTAALMPRSWFAGCNVTRNVSIGAGTWINTHCYFGGWAPITIGANCTFGPHVSIHTSAHDIEGPENRCGPEKNDPVTIGNGCWLGMRASVLPGVTIGDGCVIAAGALVAKDCEPHGLYAGVPARRIREL
jgi:maltose O-acetyltransferase